MTTYQRNRLSFARTNMNMWRDSYNFWRKRLGYANQVKCRRRKSNSLRQIANCRCQLLDAMLDVKTQLAAL